MMKNKFFIFALCFTALISSCSDDAVTSTHNSDPDSYYPLTLNNLWSYKIPGMSLTEKVNVIATGEETIFGQTYFIVEDDYYGNFHMLRKTAKGEIVELLRDTVEAIIIPSVIKLDSMWVSPDSVEYRKITSLKATVNAYDNLVEIITYDYSTNKELARNRYKKGVGCVQSEDFVKGEKLTLNSYQLK